jgi:hypothetical protein
MFWKGMVLADSAEDSEPSRLGLFAEVLPGSS